MVPTEPEHCQVVVAALVCDKQGHYLVSQRPHGKAGAGLWEFPGGKVEPGEEEQDALVRELREELGIEATAVEPLPHWRARDPAGIHLSLWVVAAFDGVPEAREGQRIRWCTAFELARMDFLPADVPLVARLWLPPYYLISAVAQTGEDAFLASLQDALARQTALVQLREPWSPRRLRSFARRVHGLCRRYGAKLLLNAPADAVSGCADGVHLTTRRLLALRERPLPRPLLVGASCHTAAELAHAARIDCDFAVISPVQATASHPGAVPLGWRGFAQLAASVALPTYALGGMTYSDLPRSRDLGGQGVALRSGAFAIPGDPVGKD
ncbi:MAG: Nudix family hydrolase [Gammaproteobacteria bacterium]|nr:Nudix family hydrolase [Gammaproteobacteria bacterium]